MSEWLQTPIYEIAKQNVTGKTKKMQVLTAWEFQPEKEGLWC